MEDKYTIRDTINGILRETKTYNYISIVLGLFIFAFVCGANGSSTGFYADNKLSYWMLSYLLVFIGLFTPLNRAKYLPYGKRFYFSGFALLILALIILAKLTWSSFIPSDGQNNIYQQQIDIIGYSVATAIVILGWFVQHQLTRQHNKTNHSLNVLLQMRVSEEFQQQTRLANRYYPSRNGTQIPKKDIELYLSNNIDFTDENLDEEHKKIESLSAHSYLLNYYEFLAFGIKSGSLDEELLYQTLGGVLIGHTKRAQNIIECARGKSRKTFVNLADLEERWRERRAFDSMQLTEKKKRK